MMQNMERQASIDKLSQRVAELHNFVRTNHEALEKALQQAIEDRKEGDAYATGSPLLY